MSKISYHAAQRKVLEFDIKISTATGLVFCMYLKRTSELVQVVTNWLRSKGSMTSYLRLDNARENKLLKAR